LRDKARNPERARSLHLARSGSQSQHGIWFILPAHGATHIIMGNIDPRSFMYAALGPYCHDLGPIFPSTALALGQEEVIRLEITKTLKNVWFSTRFVSKTNTVIPPPLPNFFGILAKVDPSLFLVSFK